MKDDCCGPTKSLDQNYELLDYKTPNTFLKAGPGERPSEITQLLPTTGKPVGGAHVADLRVQPLPAARNIPSKAWKPKGRK